MTAEDQALEYRRQQQAREDHKLAREQALAAPPEPRLEVLENWAALKRWTGWDPIRRVQPEAEE